MHLFGKKNTLSLSDILKGLQQAVSSSLAMLQAQQIDHLSRFWMHDGHPLTQKVKIGDREVDVPLFTLVPHGNLEMEEVEIKFKARIGDMASQPTANRFDPQQPLTSADLQMNMEAIRTNASDVMEISVRFKMKETPEGVARLADEYNKQI